MTQVPGGWHADPMGRFEYRYWDGTRWTDHVSRGGQTFVDPVTPAPAASTGGATTPVTTEMPIAATDTAADGEAAQPATPATTPSSEAPDATMPSASPWGGAATGATQPFQPGRPAVPPTPTSPGNAGIFQVPAPPPATPGGYQYPYMPAPAQVTVAGLAIASMVLGILWIYWLGSILAIIFGHIAISQIRRSNGWKTGKGMAIAGLVLGYIGLATLIFVIVFAVATRNSNNGVNSDRSDGFCNESRYMQDPDC